MKKQILSAAMLLAMAFNSIGVATALPLCGFPGSGDGDTCTPGEAEAASNLQGTYVVADPVSPARTNAAIQYQGSNKVDVVKPDGTVEPGKVVQGDKNPNQTVIVLDNGTTGAVKGNDKHIEWDEGTTWRRRK